MSILHRTTDLLDLYLYAVGNSEVPPPFHRWAFISSVAAAMGDRCYYCKFPGKPIYPNLYLFLIGPSACGKEHALSSAGAMLQGIPQINKYAGRLSGPALLDRLAAIGGVSQSVNPHLPPSANLLLNTEELAMSIGKGEKADETVKIMTKLYTSSSDEELADITRMHGVKTIPRPCITWQAGTTVEWFRATITADHIMSGFLSRIIVVKEWYSKARIANPTTQPDHWEVREHIKARLAAVAGSLVGEFGMTPGAKALRDQWYENRPEPSMELVYPWWKRADDLLLKLSMVYSVCEGFTRVMTEAHVRRAIADIATLEHYIEQAADLCMTNKDLQGLSVVERTIRRFRTVQHSQLLGEVRGRGVSARVLKENLYHLMEEGKIKAANKEGRVMKHLPAYWYVWTQGVSLADVEAEDGEHEEEEAVQ